MAKDHHRSCSSVSMIHLGACNQPYSIVKADIRFDTVAYSYLYSWSSNAEAPAGDPALHSYIGQILYKGMWCGGAYLALK
jgi:hypothetical protein